MDGEQQFWNRARLGVFLRLVARTDRDREGLADYKSSMLPSW
jgi:hypothetical protein